MMLAMITAVLFGFVQANTEPAPAPRDMVETLDGPATEVAVLATMHLRQLSAFEPDWANPVVDQLADWAPDLILIEQLPAREIEMMQADPAYQEVTDQFAGRIIDLAQQAQQELGLTRHQARQAVEQATANASAAERRRLAALHLANLDPASALIHWHGLAAAERRAGDGISEALAETLNSDLERSNEVQQFAVPLAARLGHDRIFAFDSHSDKRAFLGGYEAFAASFQASEVMTQVMSGDAMAELQSATASVASAEDLLAALRHMNSAPYAELDMGVHWVSFARADMDGIGRARLAYWEARNLRMAAHAREIMAQRPGGRVLIIVGAAHKPFLDDALSRSMDVEIVDTLNLLD
ncbi:DUF5694 domain-containing protein [Maricaulis sp.]|uniref:DUF5694 domain-containing protein n=1 Tax=Maricaulis sp. TaxID=1486257 RepID=UPI00260561C0|nr:DUF5694 domain-containing protein [Maricaulis sp.]